MSTVYWEKRINLLLSIISRFNHFLKASFLCIFLNLIDNSITLRKKLNKTKQQQKTPHQKKHNKPNKIKRHKAKSNRHTQKTTTQNYLIRF